MTTDPRIRLVLRKTGPAVTELDRQSIRYSGPGLSDFAIAEALVQTGIINFNLNSRSLKAGYAGRRPKVEFNLDIRVFLGDVQ